MKNQKEYRFTTKELRVQTENGKRTLSGYAAVFNTRSLDLGGWQETIVPGAFTRSLATKPDVLALSEHNPKAGLLGRTKSGTLRLSEDAIGLRFDCDLPDTQLGNDTATSIGRGDLDGCSFGFVAKDTRWDEVGDSVVRSLLDVDLYDVTVTSQPAYPAAGSLQLRSMAEIRSDDEMCSAENPEAGDDDGCQCQCPECLAGDHAECSDPDCQFDSCMCHDDATRTDRLLASLLERRLR